MLNRLKPTCNSRSILHAGKTPLGRRIADVRWFHPSGTKTNPKLPADDNLIPPGRSTDGSPAPPEGSITCSEIEDQYSRSLLDYYETDKYACRKARNSNEPHSKILDAVARLSQIVKRGKPIRSELAVAALTAAARARKRNQLKTLIRAPTIAEVDSRCLVPLFHQLRIWATAPNISDRRVLVAFLAGSRSDNPNNLSVTDLGWKLEHPELQCAWVSSIAALGGDTLLSLWLVRMKRAVIETPRLADLAIDEFLQMDPPKYGTAWATALPFISAENGLNYRSWERLFENSEHVMTRLTPSSGVADGHDHNKVDWNRVWKKHEHDPDGYKELLAELDADDHELLPTSFRVDDYDPEHAGDVDPAEEWRISSGFAQEWEAWIQRRLASEAEARAARERKRSFWNRHAKTIPIPVYPDQDGEHGRIAPERSIPRATEPTIQYGSGPSSRRGKVNRDRLQILRNNEAATVPANDGTPAEEVERDRALMEEMARIWAEEFGDSDSDSDS